MVQDHEPCTEVWHRIPRTSLSLVTVSLSRVWHSQGPQRGWVKTMTHAQMCDTELRRSYGGAGLLEHRLVWSQGWTLSLPQVWHSQGPQRGWVKTMTHVQMCDTDLLWCRITRTSLIWFRITRTSHRSKLDSCKNVSGSINDSIVIRAARHVFGDDLCGMWCQLPCSVNMTTGILGSFSDMVMHYFLRIPAPPLVFRPMREHRRKGCICVLNFVRVEVW